MTTICANCANLLRREPPSSPRYNVWYNLLCKASPLETVIDPATGETAYKDTNDLGQVVLQDDTEYKNCRYINTDGNCPKFYPRD